MIGQIDQLVDRLDRYMSKLIRKGIIIRVIEQIYKIAK